MLQLPGEFGFTRSVTVGERPATLDKFGNFVKGRERLVVVYYPPQGSKPLRSPKDVQEYLMKCPERVRSGNVTSLSTKNFSFKTQILDLGEFEIVRKVGDKKLRVGKRKPSSDEIAVKI